jgi:HD superfamily phosphodiesterase
MSKSDLVSSEDVKILEGENKVFKLKIQTMTDDIELLDRNVQLKNMEIANLEKKIQTKIDENEQILTKKQELMKEVITLETKLKTELVDVSNDL